MPGHSFWGPLFGCATKKQMAFSSCSGSMAQGQSEVTELQLGGYGFHPVEREKRGFALSAAQPGLLVSGILGGVSLQVQPPKRAIKLFFLPGPPNDRQITPKQPLGGHSTDHLPAIGGSWLGRRCFISIAPIGEELSLFPLATRCKFRATCYPVWIAVQVRICLGCPCKRKTKAIPKTPSRLPNCGVSRGAAI